MLPVELANSSNNYFSRSDNCNFNYSSLWSNSVFFYSNSGYSWLIIKLKSFPSNPLLVTVKLMIERKLEEFGYISMNEFLVHKNN